MNKLIINNNEIYLEKEDGNLSLKVNNTNKLQNVKIVKIKIENDTDLVIENKCTEEIKLDININIEKNVKANIYELKTSGKYKLQYQYKLQKNSYLNVERVIDVDETSEMTIINLNGENAHIDYNLKTISKNEEKYNFLVYHNAKNTISNIKNNGVNIEKGHLEFNVSSFVPNGVKKCDVSQSGRIINMTKNKCTIKPNLFIDEEDVIANHSALIGTFKEEEIFYLMSRGIRKKEAESMLTQGFLKKGITHHKDNIKEIIEKYWR